MYKSLGKPMLDVIVALLALIITGPIFIITAALIVIEDGMPVFFVHTRVGKDGVPFQIYKFRSMSKGAKLLASADGKNLKVTNVGRVIRRLNIDELPQLFNILKLDMSLIGPRPGLVSQTDLHPLRKKNDSIKLRPGISGLAQVNGFDGMNAKEKADWDGKYYETMSLWTDIKIVFATVRYVMRPQPIV